MSEDWVSHSHKLLRRGQNLGSGIKDSIQTRKKPEDWMCNVRNWEFETGCHFVYLNNTHNIICLRITYYFFDITNLLDLSKHGYSHFGLAVQLGWHLVSHRLKSVLFLNNNNRIEKKTFNLINFDIISIVLNSASPKLVKHIFVAPLMW